MGGTTANKVIWSSLDFERSLGTFLLGENFMAKFDILEDLKWRGAINQETDEEGLRKY